MKAKQKIDSAIVKADDMPAELESVEPGEFDVSSLNFASGAMDVGGVDIWKPEPGQAVAGVYIRQTSIPSTRGGESELHIFRCLSSESPDIQPGMEFATGSYEPNLVARSCDEGDAIAIRFERKITLGNGKGFNRYRFVFLGVARVGADGKTRIVPSLVDQKRVEAKYAHLRKAEQDAKAALVGKAK